MTARKLAAGLWTTLLLLMAAVMAAAAIATAVGGVRYFRVLSPSMAPGIEAGDLVLTRPTSAGDLQVGDVPLLVDARRGDIPFAHRIVQISSGAQGPAVTTKGDANPAPDALPMTVTSAEVPVVWAVVPLSRVPIMDGRTALVALGALLAAALLWLLLSMVRREA